MQHINCPLVAFLFYGMPQNRKAVALAAGQAACLVPSFSTPVLS
jgi:hypothetical protein